MVANKTFENLTDKRKLEIIEKCLIEFSLKDYKQASLTNVIKELELAKGSFYRYFDTKSHLYMYLIEYCTKMRFEFDQMAMNEMAIDMHAALISNFKHKIAFDKQFPLHNAFLYKVSTDNTNHDVSEDLRKVEEKMLKLSKSFLSTYKGELKTNISEDVLAYHLLKTQQTITEYILFKHKVKWRSNIEQKKSFLSGVSERNMLEAANLFFMSLLSGIQK